MIKQILLTLLGLAIGFFFPFGIGLLIWSIPEYDPVWFLACIMFSIFCGILFYINTNITIEESTRWVQFA